jgi:acetyl esterase/lipase
MTGTQMRGALAAIAWLGVVAAAAGQDGAPFRQALTLRRVFAHQADPRVARFDQASYVVFDTEAPSTADVLLFLGGTGTRPDTPSQFLDIAATLGYRVISLAYNDAPAVVGVCSRDPDPSCSAKVREKRIFGSNVTRRIDDTPDESIVNRLTALLKYLDATYPLEGWRGYLEGDTPRWDRIAVGGHSQGAGMAAFIAQRRRVPRVVLFSSPWDFFGNPARLAPWVGDGPGATPSAVWFGAYHAKENMAALIARAYDALRVPHDHIRVFTREPDRKSGDNPYHISVLSNFATPHLSGGAAAYADDWKFLAGHSR